MEVKVGPDNIVPLRVNTKDDLTSIVDDFAYKYHLSDSNKYQLLGMI